MTPRLRVQSTPYAVAVAVAVAVAGCGTLAPDAGPGGVLPSSGIGPYSALESPSPLLADLAASLDDAVVTVEGEAITLYFTRRDDAVVATIGRARFVTIDAVPELSRLLGAERDFEIGGLAQPAVLPLGGRTLLAYATGAGAIGLALSDGDGFVRAASPALPIPSGAEGPRSSPALIAIDETTVRLLYLESGRLRAADATASDLLSDAPGAFHAALVDPVLEGAAPWLQSIARTTARTALLDTGRRRHDLFLTGALGGTRTVGAAASFDGGRFLLSAEPLLDAKAPEEWAPSVARWRGGNLLVHTRSLGRHTVIAAATRL